MMVQIPIVLNVKLNVLLVMITILVLAVKMGII